MDNSDIYKQPPVYEGDQVLTQDDLIGILKGFTFQYNKTSKLNFIDRFRYRVAMNAVIAMMTWLDNGKPMIHGENHETH